MPYLEKITVSQKRRAKYHNRSKYKPFYHLGKVLPQRFNNDNYAFDTISGDLMDLRTNEKVIANPKTVGEPKVWVINFQSIYNGALNPHVRASYMNIIKDYFKDWLEIEPITEFPLRLELFLYAEKMPVDVDNKGVIYFKTFTDLLVSKSIIPDDSSEYIRDTGRTVWIPTAKHKEKMEFHITKI